MQQVSGTPAQQGCWDGVMLVTVPVNDTGQRSGACMTSTLQPACQSLRYSVAKVFACSCPRSAVDISVHLPSREKQVEAVIQELGLEVIDSDDLKVTVQVAASVSSGEVAAHNCHHGINVTHRHRHKASHRRSTTGNLHLAVFEGIQIYYRVRQSSEAKNSLLSWLDECLTSHNPSMCSQHPRDPQGHPLWGSAQLLTVAPCTGSKLAPYFRGKRRRGAESPACGLDECEPQLEPGIHDTDS